MVLDASSDFSIKDTTVKVEPKNTAECLVTFKGRISKPLSGRIIFKPKNDTEQLMAPIVYDLKSKIIGRYTTDRLVVKDVMLFDTKSKELKI